MSERIVNRYNGTDVIIAEDEYCYSDNGSSWSQWSNTSSVTPYVNSSSALSHNYIAGKYNTNNLMWGYSRFLTRQRGIITDLTLQVSVLFPVNPNPDPLSNYHTEKIYLLSEDPRNLSISQIRARAIVSTEVTLRPQALGYTFANANIDFRGLNLITSKNMYFVYEYVSSRLSQRDFFGHVYGISIDIKPFSVSASPQTVISGDSVEISLTNRLGDAAELKLSGNGKELYSGNVNADKTNITCPKSWFITAGLKSSISMTINVSATVPNGSASTSFTLKAYDLSVTSPSSLMVGDKFIAKIKGKTNSDTITAVFKYGGTELYRQVMSSDTISVTCPITWFTNINYSASKALPVTVTFTDQDGKVLTTSFNLNAPKLLIGGNKAQVTTGLGNNSVITFTITNRTIIGRTNETLTYKILYGDTEIVKRNINADSTSESCTKNWFEITGVRNSQTLAVTAIVSDALGRSASYSFTLKAGADMEPILEAPFVSIVQPAVASKFPKIYIAGYSKARVAAVVIRQTSAPITRVSFAYDGNTVNMPYNSTEDRYEAVTPNPLEHDTTFTVTVVDLRGFTKSANVSVRNVLNYIPPSFKVNTLFRCNENGVETLGGLYYKINITATYDTNLRGNQITLFQSNVIGGIAHDLRSGVDLVLSSGVTSTKRYTVQISIKDELSNTISATWVLSGGVNLIEAYNELVDKYYPYNHDLLKISERIVGFPALMQSYYNTIDMEIFLKSGLMPTVSTSSTNAAREAAKLTSSALSPVAVSNINTCSSTTASSAVLALAKCLVRKSFNVKVKESSYNQATRRWSGSFTVVNYANDEDTADTGTITVNVNSDLQRYAEQKIEMALSQESDDVTDIVQLFKLSSPAFTTELGKYSMQRLLTFRQVCQACLDIMLQSGASSVSQIHNIIRFSNQGTDISGADTATYRPNRSVTLRGVTIHVNGDGSVTLNGTALAPFQYYFADQLDGFNLTRGYYVYTLNTVASGIGALFGEQKQTKNADGSYESIIQQSVYRLDDYANGPFTVVVEGAGAKDADDSTFTGNVVFGFSVETGSSFNNYTIKPQLESGSILHPWVPPAVGTAPGNTNLSQNDLLYINLYQPYKVYLGLIDEEIKVREHEIEIVVGEYDSVGNLVTDGVQTVLLDEKNAIQDALNFERFLGDELWKEFASYRREDMLSNQNYISDGLNNVELFKAAEEFIKAAQREIYKAAESQHTIEGQLHNLMTMKEFQPLTENMCVGNWIRVGVDGNVYKLRLYSYEIDYDNMGFSVEFTNVRNGRGEGSDVSDLLSRVRSMSVSYGAVARQAASGKQSKDVIDDWNENGIPIPSKIVSSGSNQEFVFDENGLSGKEFLPDTNMYSPTQIKMAANGLYATTDAWLTGKTVVGKYTYRNPDTGQIMEGYGSIAELLTGHMVLGDGAKIFNNNGTILIDQNGIKAPYITVTGSLQVRGTKNRIAETEDYGDRLMYSYETAAPMFGDIGEGELDDKGVCIITLDPIFAQTISQNGYQVFLQRYGSGDCYVSERDVGSFIVCGTPGMKFGWELKASQAGYENVRLEKVAS